MVPEGWSVATLEEISATDYPIRYGVVQIGKDTEGGIPIVPIKFINSIGSSKLHRASPEIEGQYANSRIRGGDVLLSVKGTIGRVGVVPEGFDGNIAREIARIRPSKEYDAFYVALQLQADSTQRRIQNVTVGTTRREFSIHAVRKFSIATPPLPEQKKIAQILSTWDQAITATERLLENSQQRKKGLMQQLLTGKKRLPGFEGEWREEELGKLVAISKGEQLNRSTLSEAGLYPVINGGITPSGYTDKTNCHGNTVTISEGGNSCGFVAFQQVPFWCGGHCYALKSPQVPVMFLYQLLKLYEVKIMRMRVGSGLPNIQKKDLSSLKLCLPSCPDEQEAIGQILGLADKECRLLVDRLNSLKQEKKALMQQLLTGKRRVQVDTEAA